MNLFFTKIKEIKPSQWFFVGIVVMIAIAHVLIYSFMPYTCDDYWYMTPFRGFFMGVDTSFPAESLWHCWSDHYQTDNIRLANIVFSFFLLLPKVLPSIICGLLVGVILWMSAKMCNISSRNPLLVAILALMLSFLLPWYEQMFSLCFAFNYIWASALTISLAYIFFYKDKQVGVVLSLLLGIIVGAWHEGFSIPLLAGFMVYAFTNRRMINHRHIAIMCGLVVGILWLLHAPGLQLNVGNKVPSLSLSSVFSKLVLYHIPLLVLLFSVIIASIGKNTRNLIFDPIFVALSSICFIGAMMNLILNVGVRTGWMGYLFGIIATIYLWKKMKNARYTQFKSVLKRTLAIAVALFLFAHYAIVVYYSNKVRTEFETVIERYQESSDGVVFADVTYDYQASPLAWKKPYFENFTYTWIPYWVDKYYDCGKNLRVIPPCLINAEDLKAVKVKGDNPFMIYNGYLFAPIDNDQYVAKEHYYEIDFGHVKKTLMCTNFIFTTSKGNKYYFSFPQRATVHRWIGEIEEMNSR